MNFDELKKVWKEEEKAAVMRGWDFSHIEDRYKSGDDELPWDYASVIKEYLTDDKMLLDMDTGGGEFLLSLGHPYDKTAATEAYTPNVKLCRKELIPLGINFQPAISGGKLPFEDGSFDMVINRHGGYDADEVYRVLRKGGMFITQQVGGNNDRELVELLCSHLSPKYQGHCLENELEKFSAAGFEIVKSDECYLPIEFYDVGALVWFARIIEWEFLGFSVDRDFERLCEAQRILEKDGRICGSIHRFMIAAKK